MKAVGNGTLNAKENINITAAEQGNVTNTENNTSSGFAGMSIGLGTGTIGVNVSGSAGVETIDNERKKWVEKLAFLFVGFFYGVGDVCKENCCSTSRFY